MNNKLKIYFFVVVSLFMFLASTTRAEAQVNEIYMEGNSVLWTGDNFSLNVTPCVGDQYIEGTAFTKNQADCIEKLIQNLDKNTQKTIQAYMKKRLREEWWDQMKTKLKEAMAGAFKKSLENIARQIGRDTAVWVASGGRGQKPLFITEGWGAYMKNIADVALGDFIDQIGQSFGVDLCEPDFNIKLAIILGIDDRQTRRVRCSFSKIIQNWESAISNFNFSVEYRAALRPGENDISVALILADKKHNYIAGIVEAAAKEAETQGLWANIKDIAGKILTPGSMIHDKFKSDIHDTSKLGWETFTDTIWDLIGSFLDTLVGQLALNLKNGFFSSSPVKSDDNSNLPDLSSLFNPWSSPVVAGIKGAEGKFNYLKTSTIKVGGQYDLLNKLTACQDPNNPGPMGCVLDVNLASAIRQKTLVKDLPEEILNRPFVPLANKVENPNEYFSLRGVTILRKYRIVPVGWEYAANLISQLAAKNPNFKAPTLKQIMNEFNNTNSDYFGLIDPFWVLKAPDMFCRREGYGPQNSFSGDQNGAIFRDNYCADEQQCIKENDDGSCAAYGYCTEERRVWNFGKSCEPRYNTCNTYVNRLGQTNYWLTNTLDFRDCDQSTVGCRWFSIEYNPVSKYWVGAYESNFYTVNNETTEQQITLSDDSGWLVRENQYVSNNKQLIMASPCTEVLCKDPAMNGKCNFVNRACKFNTGLSCSIPSGGINCRLPICDSQTDAFASGNGGFEEQEGIYTDNAKKWSDELSFITLNNRAYREINGGKSGAGLRVLANGSPSDILLLSDSFSVNPGSSYHLKFDLRGSVGNQGKVFVFVYGGDKRINSNNLSDIKILGSIEINAGYISNNWTSFRSSEFQVQEFSTATIAIMAPQGTFADIRFDNFSLNEVSSKCFENSVTVFSSIKQEDRENIKDIYFDRDAESCSPDSAGCSQFLRLKAGIGTNLVYDGGFEYGDFDWNSYWGGSKLSPIAEIKDGKAKLRYSTASYSTYKPINVEPNDYYTVSFDAAQTSDTNHHEIKFEMAFVSDINYAGKYHYEVKDTNCSQTGDNTITLIFTPESTNMKRQSCWFKVPSGAKILLFKPFASSETAEIYFDNLKIEKVNYPSLTPTAYTPYNLEDIQNQQVTYLRKAPDYFNCYYYTAEGVKRWPITPSELNSVLANRSLACSQFAGVCAPYEVGCELYKPLNGDPTVPGVANDIDVCPAECAGYQVYKQEVTRFVNDKYRQFITDNKIKYCSASYAGCDEFTNLDELGRGAEAKEYYSAIRACQKPDIDDGAFYTWEGSDVTGYQLKAYNLKKSTSTDPDPNGIGGIAPCTNLFYDNQGKPKCNDPSTWPTSSEELEKAGFCTVNDLVTNADCRQFYDVEGNVHYRLLSRTISVSNNCHPYRRTMTQNSTAETEEDCKSHSGWWNSNNECIYMAIPGEGMKCPASAKGCRAYTGNKGNNVRNIIEVANFGLQSSTTGSWVGADGTSNGLFVSSESTFPGGNSLMNRGTTVIKHPVKIKKGKTYILSFWAKGSDNFSMDSIKFTGAGTDTSKYFAVKQIRDDNLLSNRPNFKQDWNLYQLGPVFVDWEPSDNEYLEFNLPTGAGITAYNIYLDNVILKEIVNNVYAIENSWYTPVSCDNKLDDPDGSKSITTGSCQDSASGRCSIGEMLGCTGYTNRANQTVYLKSFASLCRSEAAGCEALIDTKNNNTSLAKSYHVGDNSQVNVSADEQVYLVNSPQFSCPASDKGCTPYGLPIIDQQDNVISYQSVFIKNQPDKYEIDLCYAKNLWCEEYSANGGAKYFKDPHNKICVYGSTRTSTSAIWYKIGTNGDPCDVTFNQTYGTGYGSLEKKLQPVGVVSGATYSSSGEPVYTGWAGACSQDQSGCTEFVDPLTEMYKEELGKLNSDNSVSYLLKANTLYSISNDSFYKININSDNCEFIPQDITYSRPGDTSSGYLYYAKPNSDDKYCNVTISSSDNKIKVAKAGVYYKIANSVDKSSCNGLVDFGTGCVLFNDRSGIDYSTTTMFGRNKYLNFDANYTYFIQGYPFSSQKVGPKTAQEALNSGSTQNSNNTDIILQVKPDRTCSNWLACTSYIKGDGNSSNEKFGEKDYCLSVNACDELSEDNQCSHLVSTNKEIIDLTSTTTRLSYLNKTGYSVPGLYPVDQMKYEGQGANVGNGNFEVKLNSGKPLSWVNWSQNIAWDPSMFSVVYDPKNAPEGSNYLRINFKSTAKSEIIDVISGQDYYLSAWINTESLKSSSSPLKERAEIVVMNAEKDEEINRVMVSAGLPWARVTRKFTANAKSIYLLLRNSPDGPPFSTSNTGQPVGYSLFDDIQITPVLNDNGDGLMLPKTCRIYPSADAPACKYSSGNTNYYGWYGYCLTPDPNRRSDCLQWFPVDKIKGEFSSDYALGYDNRAPLYYCIDWDIVSFNINDLGVIGNIGEDVKAKYRQKVSAIITDNRKVTPIAFNIDPEYAGMFRYPYIYRFIFVGAFGGLQRDNNFKLLPILTFMYPKCAVGFFGYLPIFHGSDCKDIFKSHSIFSSRTEEEIKNEVWIKDIFESCLAPEFKKGGNEGFWMDKMCGDGWENGGYWYGKQIGKSSNQIGESSNKQTYKGSLYFSSSSLPLSSPSSSSTDLIEFTSNNNSKTEIADFDGSIDGYMDDYTYKNDGKRIDYYQCLNREKKVWDWGNNDCEVAVRDFCEENTFCQRDNPNNDKDESSCREFCLGTLDSIDYEIESCIKEKVQQAKADRGDCNFAGLNISQWIRCVVSKLVNIISSIWLSVSNIAWNDTEDVWGGFGAFGFVIEGIDIKPLVFPTTFSGALNAPNIIFAIELVANAIKAIGGQATENIFIGVGASGVKIITDQDSKYASSLTDPDPNVSGNVLGYAWFLNTSELKGAGLVGHFEGYMNIPYCKKFVKVVTASGQNKAYYSKVGLGSNYSYTVNAQSFGPNPASTATFTYNMDYMPFGAIVPPSSGNIDEPITWDSKTLSSIDQGNINLPGVNVSGLQLIQPTVIGVNYSATKQPLFFETPVLSYGNPYQARAGGSVIENSKANFFNNSFKRIAVFLNTTTTLQQLFAKSYGIFIWHWDEINIFNPNLILKEWLFFTNSNDNTNCVQDNGNKICTPVNGSGGSYKEELASLDNWDNVSAKGLGSIIDNIKLEIISKYETISLAKLSFNVTIPVDQLPIKSYTIAWGDGTVDTFSGFYFNDKPNPSNTFTVYHTYDFNKLKEVFVGTSNSLPMPCCYPAGGEQCYEQSSDTNNVPQTCDDDSCEARVFISVRDNWNKVNYCNSIDGINQNFITVSISSN